jgi:hypothetical protein
MPKEQAGKQETLETLNLAKDLLEVLGFISKNSKFSISYRAFPGLLVVQKETRWK